MAFLAVNVRCKEANDYWQWMDSVYSKINEISENLPEYTADFMEKAQTHGEKLKKTMGNYADEIAKNYEGSKLKDIVENLPEYTTDFMEKAQSHGEQFQKKMKDFTDEMAKNYEGSKLQEVANDLNEKAQKHGKKLHETMKDYANKIGEQYEGSKLQEFANNLPEYTDQVLEKLEEKEKVLKENLKSYAEKIQKNYEGSEAQKMANELFEKAQVHGNNLNEKFSEFATEIHKKYEGSEAQKVANALFEDAKNVGEKLKDTVDEYMIGKNSRNGKNPMECIFGKLSANRDTSLKTMFTGGLIGAVRNSLRYNIKRGGRRSNVVSIYDKSSISSRGNPRWFARVDLPHGKVPYAHINVNPKLTGVPDPHIPISGFTANAAGVTGSALNFINKVAPTVMMMSSAYCAYDLVRDDDGVSAKRKVIDGASTATGGYFGSSIGATIGTMLFPGIGTLAGSIVGGAYGGEFGECFSDSLEDVVDYLWDIYQQDSCYPEFESQKEEFFGLFSNKEQCIVGY